jgi:hypothetical protein
MPQNFLRPHRDQPLLMPVDMREWLPEDDLVFVVLDAVALLILAGRSVGASCPTLLPWLTRVAGIATIRSTSITG